VHDLENAEIPQFDAVIFDQRCDDGVESLLNDFLGLKLREPDLLGNGFDYLFLGHVGIPSENRPLEWNRVLWTVWLMPQV